jgi:hypothetical protein
MDELRVMLKRFRRVMLQVRMLESAATGAIFGGIVAAVAMVLRVLDWPAGIPLEALSAWVIPVVFLSAGGFCGAFVALLRGASKLQAARLVDQRYDLKERLGTASELLTASDESPEAQFVYAQATRVACALPRRLNFWRCTRRTPACLLLAILLCVAMLLPPDPDARLAERLLADDAQQQEELKEKLRQAARQADPKTQPLLMELSRTIEVRDRAELQRILEKLRQAGVDVRAVLSARGSSTETFRLDRTGRSETATPTPDQSTETSAQQPVPNESLTRIYHPRYRMDDARENPKSFSHRDTPLAGHQGSVQTDWRKAKNQAAQADASVPAPSRYRFILREFCR